MVAAWLRGDMATVAADRAALAALAQEIRQPAQHWYVATIETLVAAFEGRFADAEALGEEALRIGLRVQKWQPTMYHDLQLWARRAEQGRLAELGDAVRDWQRANPSYRILDCLAMLQLARGGRRAEALDALDALAAD